LGNWQIQQICQKNYGKKIKKYLYLPLLDDRNINDQGIDATGATIANGNLYGSSKDVGTIVGKLPTLTEHGGRKLTFAA
jgi:N4-gp56 family major capsid protein